MTNVEKTPGSSVIITVKKACYKTLLALITKLVFGYTQPVQQILVLGKPMHVCVCV